MKKHYSFLLCLFVALSSFLLSCGGSKKPEDANRCKITVVATTGGKVKISKYLETSELVMVGSEVEIVATPDKGYTFAGWYVGNATEPVSSDAVFTFVATKNSTLTAYFAKNSNTINGHEYVDLGLPSGLKWATCNVGANNPWEYGGYYAWGETEEKSNYKWSTYKWCNGRKNTKTKYCDNSDYGNVDNRTVLEPQDDVAHVKWGSTWRMPTTDEQRELLNECSWERAELDGVSGYSVTGPNGNSIFLPAAGCRDGAEVKERDCGYFWSSIGGHDCLAYYFGFGGGPFLTDGCCDPGFSVRPVSE